MRKIGVILLSGGLDSTTVTAYAKNQGYELVAITLRYGQKHNKEIDSAKKIAQVMGVKQEVIDVFFFSKLAWYSALTNSQLFNVPKQSDFSEIPKIIPMTYVPLRNKFL